MTTDITELAQSLKAAADREMICRDVAETSEIWERTVTPENILALVEALENSESRLHEVAVACATAEQALEKAQAKADIYDMLRDDYGLCEKGVGLADFVDWQAKRIAELESRTVTVSLPDIMPPEAAPAHYWDPGESMAYADGYNKSAADLKTSFAQACSSAGVNVEFE
ncbi:TPA: hypothetical protein RRU26_000094 [Klebsiella pneumoniae]|nr:hypothetical protein [Klebsiella pneumoniae]